jgi:hypothetical protein
MCIKSYKNLLLEEKFVKRDISLWQFAGFALTSLFGTLLHFMYEWSGNSLIIAPFSGVNESTWEHMKLLYFPLLLFALVQSKFFKGYKNFWCVKLLGILTGLIMIPVLFYTLNGVFGKTPDWLNIAIFFISTACSFLLEAVLLKNGNFKCKKPLLAFLSIYFIGILFIVFTFFTPKIPIFLDPVSGAYGIK